MFAPILVTKLYVPVPRLDTVPRPRLLARLNTGLAANCKLTLISAPAGFGKTTLLSSWIAGLRLPVEDGAQTGAATQATGQNPKSAIPNRVAWLSLDERDNDPVRFLTYLVAAVQTLAPDVGTGVMAALQAPQPPPPEVLLAALLNDIAGTSSPCILVLDDYHALDSPSVDAALAFLLDHLPPQLLLIIATREDPNLPLGRLRARGQLTELRAADLRFTPVEAAEFLNRVMDLGLSAEEIAALESRTEGWIAGLQLAALSMRGQPDNAHFIQNFTGSHRFVLDYLLEEVLHRQSAEIQTFLLRTSILDRLCGPLCDILQRDEGERSRTETQPATVILEYLERVNLFLVPLDDERRWYRYHHLFGDLLRKQLRQDFAPDQIVALHLRASAWYERNGLALEAFRHATLAHDVERAERLIGSPDMHLHFRSVVTPIRDWLAALPQEVLDARPILWIRSATLALISGQTTGVEEKLQAAEKSLRGVALDDATRDLLGQIACARATLALTRYDPETMLVQARRALEYLHRDNLTFRFTANWALASASLLQGDRQSAAQACREGIALSQKSGDRFSIILAISDLGAIQEWETQLHQAAESYRRALELSGEHPHPNAGEVHLGLARIHYE